MHTVVKFIQSYHSNILSFVFIVQEIKINVSKVTRLLFMLCVPVEKF